MAKLSILYFKYFQENEGGEKRNINQLGNGTLHLIVNKLPVSSHYHRCGKNEPETINNFSIFQHPHFQC
jgi:hypothetical protein